MKQKIIKVGNSIGVTIPSSFVKAAGLTPGETVEVKVNVQRGEVVYKFSGSKQMLLEQSLEE
jgi:antitoxin component of MazEF toxin-antitoxin module